MRFLRNSLFVKMKVTEVGGSQPWTGSNKSA
jgi:hypothetical protein